MAWDSVSRVRCCVACTQAKGRPGDSDARVTCGTSQRGYRSLGSSAASITEATRNPGWPRTPGGRMARVRRSRGPMPPPWPWTDDTAMALGILGLLERHGRIEQDELARRFASDWRAGWGPSPLGTGIRRNGLAGGGRRTLRQRILRQRLGHAGRTPWNPWRTPRRPRGPGGR